MMQAMTSMESELYILNKSNCYTWLLQFLVRLVKTSLKNIENVTRYRDTRSAKAGETR